jgi:hypothetical protein
MLNGHNLLKNLEKEVGFMLEKFSINMTVFNQERMVRVYLLPRYDSVFSRMLAYSQDFTSLIKSIG